MAMNRPAPSKKSSNPKTTKSRTSNRAGTPVRPDRDDTWEARRDIERTPKTHPTRSPSSRRKDK
jgi:hypothetical protein